MMTYKKQAIFVMAVASIISVGMISSLILVSTTHESFAQVKTETGQNNIQKQSGMHTGSMNTNMTVDQMLDMMDMMHGMMMSMMRMMAHNGAMNASSMTGSMNSMNGMQ